MNPTKRNESSSLQRIATIEGWLALLCTSVALFSLVPGSRYDLPWLLIGALALGVGLASSSVRFGYGAGRAAAILSLVILITLFAFAIGGLS